MIYLQSRCTQRIVHRQWTTPEHPLWVSCLTLPIELTIETGRTLSRTSSAHLDARRSPWDEAHQLALSDSLQSLMYLCRGNTIAHVSSISRGCGIPGRKHPPPLPKCNRHDTARLRDVPSFCRVHQEPTTRCNTWILPHFLLILN